MLVHHCSTRLCQVSGQVGLKNKQTNKTKNRLLFFSRHEKKTIPPGKLVQCVFIHNTRHYQTQRNKCINQSKSHHSVIIHKLYTVSYINTTYTHTHTHTHTQHVHKNVRCLVATEMHYCTRKGNFRRDLKVKEAGCLTLWGYLLQGLSKERDFHIQVVIFSQSNEGNRKLGNKA